MTLILTHRPAANPSFLHPKKLRSKKSHTVVHGDTARSCPAHFHTAQPCPKIKCKVRAEVDQMSDQKQTSPANLTTNSRFLGRIFAPKSEGTGWWDDRIFSFPHVVRTTSDQAIDGKYSWRMYYYGRDTNTWQQGVSPNFSESPLGRVGMAISEDGLSWKRLLGPLSGGAILDPSENPEAFDSVQVGVGEVIPGGAGAAWKMYYFGGGLDGVQVPNTEKEVKGVRMRVGLAVSHDGIHFERTGDALLDVGGNGEFDENSVGFPRVVPPSPDGRIPHWVLAYHTLSFTRGFSVGVATSANGRQWTKRGEALSKGPEGAWDQNGVASRAILRIGDKLVMFYEGIFQASRYSIGIATSDDGINWEKDTWAGSQPGGPIFTPRTGEDAWDSLSVGTPNVVPMPDGSFRLYYTGQGQLASGEAVRGFGLAISDGADFRSWQRYGSPVP